MEHNRLDILRKVEQGEISLDQASEMLTLIEQNQHENITQPEVIYHPEESIQDQVSPSKEKPSWAFLFWVIPLIFGLILTIFSSTWLYQNYQSSGLGFKFWLTWIPFLIGVFMIYFGWILQKARWIHVNIKQPKGERPQRILIAFPLPFQLLGLIFRLFKGKMPSKMGNFDIEELMESIDQQIKKEEPLYVHVDDEDGTKVEVYIG
ncbi:MAG: hypothetical protein Q7U53_03970 [Anaerolineaceae bacterium]|nr:hypothetical protein [Anaerolineaceae bacterium]